MAIKPVRFSVHSPSCLGECYRVRVKANGEVYLHSDVRSIFPHLPEAEAQFDEPVLRLLEDVELYEKSSFLKRWHLRMSTPIRAQHQKLYLVCEYFHLHRQKNKDIPLPNVLPQLMLKINQFTQGKLKPARWWGAGKIHSYVLSEAKSIWQGLVYFMRTLFSKNTYTVDIEAKSTESKRELELLYQREHESLEVSYFAKEFTGGFKKAEKMIVETQEKVDLEKAKICGPFRKPEEWMGSGELSDQDARERIELLNATFTGLQKEGQEALNRTKRKILLFETLREHFGELETKAKASVKKMQRNKRSAHVHSEELMRVREKSMSECRRWILYSPDSRILQRRFGVLPQELSAFFSKQESRLEQIFTSACKTAEKKRDLEKVPATEKEQYNFYRNFLSRMAEVLSFKDADSIHEKRLEIMNDYQQFSSSLGDAPHLAIWNQRMQDTDEALKWWPAILKKHREYEGVLKEAESQTSFLEFSQIPQRHYQLCEAHAQGLRKILMSCETHPYFLSLSNQVERLIDDFDQAVIASQKASYERFPISTAAAHKHLPDNDALIFTDIYENYMLQYVHAILGCESRDEALAAFCEKAQDKMRALSEELLKSLSDLSESREECEILSASFIEKIQLHQDFLDRITHEIKARNNNILLTSIDVNDKGKEELDAYLQDEFMILNARFVEMRERLLSNPAALLSVNLLIQMRQLQVDEMNRRLLLPASREQSVSFFLSMKEQAAQFVKTYLAPQVEELKNAQSLLKQPKLEREPELKQDSVKLPEMMEVLEASSYDFTQRLFSGLDFSKKPNRKTRALFEYLKSEFDRAPETFQSTTVARLIEVLKNFQTELHLLSVKNIRFALQGCEIFLENMSWEEEDRKRKAGKSYFSNKAKALKMITKNRLQEVSKSLQGELPEFTVLIKKLSECLWNHFEEEVLSFQEKTFMEYFKKPSSLKALADESELAQWIRGALLDYNLLIGEMLVEYFEDHPFSASGTEYVRKERDRKQEALCESLYEHLIPEEPGVQLSSLIYAQKNWQERRLDENEFIGVMIRVWRILKEANLWEIDAEWEKEDKECAELFRELSEKKSEFLQVKDRENWPENEALFRRLISWQRNMLNRSANQDQNSALEAFTHVSKRTKKILQIFELAYNPDKHGNEKEWVDFYFKNVCTLKSEAENLIELSKNPGNMSETKSVPLNQEEESVGKFLKCIVKRLSDRKKIAQMEVSHKLAVSQLTGQIAELKAEQATLKEQAAQNKERLRKREERLNKNEERINKNEEQLNKNDADLHALRVELEKVVVQLESLGINRNSIFKQHVEGGPNTKEAPTHQPTFFQAAPENTQAKEATNTSISEEAEEACVVSAPEGDETISVEESSPTSPHTSGEGFSRQQSFFQATKSATPPKEPSPTLSSASENVSPRH
jgi:hypothetical protein